MANIIMTKLCSKDQGFLQYFMRFKNHFTRFYAEASLISQNNICSNKQNVEIYI